MFFNKKNKIFCIGFNKTGTTSLEKALKDFGYKMGNQREGELLFDDWIQRDFSSLERLCNKADAFQDAPFSLPFTFTYLDQKYPRSKFILTIRDTSDVWYESLVSFHGKLWGKNSTPTKQDLLDADYLYKGYAYKSMKFIFNTPDDDLYNKEMLVNSYNNHNKLVKEYFIHRPHDLLILNLSEKNSYLKLCEFLEKKPMYNDFPWENKT